MSVHLTQLFAVNNATPERLFDEADRIMDALLDMEDADSTITDSTVSVDAGRGEVAVELYLARSDCDHDEASLKMQARIREALATAGITVNGSGNDAAAQESRRELVFA